MQAATAMKRLTATALGWLHKTNATAHYFYCLISELERQSDSRAERARELMREGERDIVRQAYQRDD